MPLSMKALRQFDLLQVFKSISTFGTVISVRITALTDFKKMHWGSEKCVPWLRASFEGTGASFTSQVCLEHPREERALIEEEQKGNCHSRAHLELQFRLFWGRYLHSNTKVDHWNTGISVPADVHRSVATVWWLTFEWGAGCTEIVLRFLVYSSFIRRLYEMQGKSIFLPLCNNIYNWKN